MRGRTVGAILIALLFTSTRAQETGWFLAATSEESCDNLCGNIPGTLTCDNTRASAVDSVAKMKVAMAGATVYGVRPRCTQWSATTETYGPYVASGALTGQCYFKGSGGAPTCASTATWSLATSTERQFGQTCYHNPCPYTSSSSRDSQALTAKYGFRRLCCCKGADDDAANVCPLVTTDCFTPSAAPSSEQPITYRWDAATSSCIDGSGPAAAVAQCAAEEMWSMKTQTCIDKSRRTAGRTTVRGCPDGYWMDTTGATWMLDGTDQNNKFWKHTTGVKCMPCEVQSTRHTCPANQCERGSQLEDCPEWKACMNDPKSCTELMINDRDIKGTLPYKLGLLTALKRLHLHVNKISGTIPYTFGALTALHDLQLWGNKISSTVPASFALMTTLRSLGMHMNFITGAATAFCSLIDASPKQFTETSCSFGQKKTTFNGVSYTVAWVGGSSCPICMHQGAGTGGCDYHKECKTDVSSDCRAKSGKETGNVWHHKLPGTCSLATPTLGSSPCSNRLMTECQAFKACLATPEACTTLELNNHFLTGTIAATIGQLTALERLYLNGNDFSGTITSELSKLTNLKTLWLHDNKFTGASTAMCDLAPTITEGCLLGNNALWTDSKMCPDCLNIGHCHQDFSGSSALPVYCTGSSVPQPTPNPTAAPLAGVTTPTPTVSPTPAPTDIPTESPTNSPTKIPVTPSPTNLPTVNPTWQPTREVATPTPSTGAPTLDMSVFATKQDTAAFATKEEIAAFATKQDTAAFATKQDTAAFATKEETAAFATKEETAAFATKEDTAALTTGGLGGWGTMDYVAIGAIAFAFAVASIVVSSLITVFIVKKAVKKAAKSGQDNPSGMQFPGMMMNQGSNPNPANPMHGAAHGMHEMQQMFGNPMRHMRPMPRPMRRVLQQQHISAPAAPRQMVAAPAPAPAPVAAAAPQMNPEKVWTTGTSQTTGKTFYHNTETNETCWDHPGEEVMK